MKVLLHYAAGPGLAARLHALPGLVNLVFVFQQADEESALVEEIAP